MPEKKSTTNEVPDSTVVDVQGITEQIAREGAQRILQAALEAEVEEHLSRYRDFRDKAGRQAVVRNGHAPQRTILSGVGAVRVARPRIDERKAKGREDHEEFSSGILLRFLRRTPRLEGALATLYLKGISTNDFPTALAVILGQGARGLGIVGHDDQPVEAGVGAGV